MRINIAVEIVVIRKNPQNSQRSMISARSRHSRRIWSSLFCWSSFSRRMRSTRNKSSSGSMNVSAVTGQDGGDAWRRGWSIIPGPNLQFSWNYAKLLKKLKLKRSNQFFYSYKILNESINLYKLSHNIFSLLQIFNKKKYYL